MTSARVLAGLRELASTYDDFLVDLWGVVHDGQKPYDGVLDALTRLRDAGKRVVFLTNASRNGDKIAEGLAERMGIVPALYTALVSSGDVTRAALVAKHAPLFALVPARPRCVHIGDASFVPWLFELGLDFVDDPASADLLFATGTVPSEAALDEVVGRLAPALARQVPMVCTNPDRVIPSGDRITLGPGAVAHAYATRGGRVFAFGKPHAPIYAAALAVLATLDREDAQPRRVVAIGDLLETDIRGARDAGLPGALVTSGIHRADVGPDVTTEARRAFFEAQGIAPDFVITRFSW